VCSVCEPCGGLAFRLATHLASPRRVLAFRLASYLATETFLYLELEDAVDECPLSLRWAMCVSCTLCVRVSVCAKSVCVWGLREGRRLLAAE